MKTFTCFSSAILTILFSIVHISAQEALKSWGLYDFVPGDRIIFEDDFSQDPSGEFPARWDLISGQGVVNTFNGKPSFLLTDGNYGRIQPLLNDQVVLTDSFTIEFDFYTMEGVPNTLLFLSDPSDSRFIEWGTSVFTGYFPSDFSADVPGAEENFSDRWHHAAFSYKKGQIKCYVDQYRTLVIPRIGFVPEEIGFGGNGNNETPLNIANVRIATGNGSNMIGRIMADGKWIARGITFDVNKSTIRPESMGTLNAIVMSMKEKPELKFEISGHTDSDGDDAANLKLSESRASAVKSQLVSMGVDASRLSTKGFGETQPIESNSTPEGKSANRRVEFSRV